ncbi:sel1 repeat family protein, partial [Lactobacillus crispatus]|uniref:sel1 repeat family protein n=1 Tax=Lactobacillus crispatus TaxID=47770 RepID=UPI0010D744A7
SSLLRSAAGRGDTDAMLALGGFEATRDQNALKPGGRARDWYSKAANAGSAEAMYRLAMLDTKPQPDDRKPDDAAITLYRRAMEAGHRDAAARYLSLNLRFGFDKTRNRAVTIAALRENAAAGNLASMVELGRLYS